MKKKKKTPQKNTRSPNSPFWTINKSRRTRWESKKAWKSGFQSLFSIYETVIHCSVLCPECYIKLSCFLLHGSLFYQTFLGRTPRLRNSSGGLEWSLGLSTSLLGSQFSRITGLKCPGSSLQSLQTQHRQSLCKDLTPDAHKQSSSSTYFTFQPIPCG